MKYNKYLKYLRYLTIAYTATLCILFPHLLIRKSTISNVDFTLGIVVEVMMIVLLFALIFVTFLQKEEVQQEVLSVNSIPPPESAPIRYVMADNSTPKSWVEVTKQEDITDIALMKFREQFIKKTNLNFTEFAYKEEAETEIINNAQIWTLGKFRLISDSITNLYSLEEYIS